MRSDQTAPFLPRVEILPAMLMEGCTERISVQPALAVTTILTTPSNQVAVIDWFMKHVAAQLVPMWDKQSAKFEEGGPLRHLMTGPEKHVYAELLRRLAVLRTDGGGDGGDVGGLHGAVRTKGSRQSGA